MGVLYEPKEYNYKLIIEKIVEGGLMNLTARIKSAKYKPNYVLNVNINIPIRPSHLQSDRPVSGEFTFSPSQLKKKLKLEIPSARTTNQCESRKVSYLGDTLNTISHRGNNRRGLTKSAQPSILTSQIKNISKKSKSQYRSQAASPSRKKITSKSTKLVTSNKNLKNNNNNNTFVNELLNQSQDNFINYTHQSSQFEKAQRLNQKSTQANGKNFLKTFNFKSESPLLQERGLISEIRQFQKNAQYKKEHLNYIYLKEKVLVLASVKKIQRAWRNYKTKKLIKSYSNNISLKFTDKIKNKLQSGEDSQEFKILTVRSCGFNGRSSEMKRQAKKNLSQLFSQDESEQISGEESKEQAENMVKESRRRFEKKQRQNAKSAIVKFQMQEINKWEELIKHIREGKRVEQVLEKSFKRKEELEKQLSNNLKQESLEENSSSSNEIQKINEEKSKQDIKQQIISKVERQQVSDFNKKQIPQNNNSLSSENSYYERLKFFESPFAAHEKKSEQNRRQFVSKFEDEEQQEGLTTKRRRRKLQFFENEIRKIDNQESQSNLSQSYHSFSSMEQESPEEKSKKVMRDTEEEENLKLKRKLQAINRVHLFNEMKDETENEMAKFERNQLLLERKKIPEQKPLLNELHVNKQVLLLSINREFPKQEVFDDRLDTFRSRKQLENHKSFYYEDEQEERLTNFKRMRLNTKQKGELAQKIEQELFYDLLLDLSDKQRFISKMEILYAVQNKVKKAAQENKPEGICTNLQSIKDYLQNFVAFAFEQQPMKVVAGFNSTQGPSTAVILKYLNNNQIREQVNFHVPVLPIELFNLHWFYASQQIYFDAKYPDDILKEEQRVKYLKSITKTYFRAIFDGFNECLQPFRLYGQVGKPFPWASSVKKNAISLTLNQIKPLIRLAYRKLSQIAILYCGLLFEDKRHNMTPDMIEQIQNQRLKHLIEIEQVDEQIKWNMKQIEETEVLWKLSHIVQQILILEMCWELGVINHTK